MSTTNTVDIDLVPKTYEMTDIGVVKNPMKKDFIHKYNGKRIKIKAGGKIRERKDGFLSIDSVPFGIRLIADEDSFKKSFGDLLKKYPKATFDKETAFKNPDAEFICFGHPLFEATMNFIDQKYSDTLLTGATFLDPDGFLDGYIIFYEGEIKDGTGTVAGKRLFSFYVQDQKVIPFPASIIWDLAEGENSHQEFIDVEKLKKKTSVKAIEDLAQYRNGLLSERYRQAEIKQKYGFKSLEYLIVKLDGELIGLYDRKERGENVDLVIRNKEERKAVYEKSLIELKKQIEKEKSLTMSVPRFLGIIRVISPPTLDQSMRNDPEVERIGMEIAMEYERKQNRMPEDVSAENLGFDIRSKDPKTNSIRYIEVKARSQVSAVSLTQNEWFKAKRFKDDYYLYAVMPTSDKPRLYIIQNPAENLKPDEKVEIVRYIIGVDEILNKGLNHD